MRFLTVPYLKGKNAFAAAFEVFPDTATEDTLGADTAAFGAQAFFVRFFQPGTLTPGGGLFAPGFQYKFDVDKEAGRDDTDQFLIDLNLLVMAEDKQSWFFTDPQIVIDFETNEEYCVCDFEFGWMMSKCSKVLKAIASGCVQALVSATTAQRMPPLRSATRSSGGEPLQSASFGSHAASTTWRAVN